MEQMSRMQTFYRRVGIPVIVVLFLLLPLFNMTINIHSQSPLSATKSAMSYGSGIVSSTACENATCVAHSNATLTQFHYTETSHTFNVTVSGSSDTTGYVNITVPKSIISDPSQISVFANGNRISGSALSVTSNSNSYFLYFTLNFPNSNNSNLAATLQPYLIVGAVVSVSFVLLFIRTRRIPANPSIRTKSQI